MTDRPYATAEQYERWFIRDCVRCGRRGNFAGRWPDGHICRTCHDRALRLRGRCPQCGDERILPGLDTDRNPLCTGCAGFTYSYACSRCGTESKLHARRLCTRCTLHDRLAELLDEGTGRVRPELEPLHQALVAMGNPLSGLTWLYRHQVPDLLRSIATNQAPLTHETFHQLQPWRAAAHLRELLMNCGVLPVVDKQILLFERWLTERLPAIEDVDHRRVVRQFASWCVLPWLHGRAARQPLTLNTRRHAGAHVNRAADFLTWLTNLSLPLSGLGQGELDQWATSHRDHHRRDTTPFFKWAIHTARMPRLRIPTAPVQRREPITQHRRLALIGRLLTDETGGLRTRVAALLVLLYAQPLSRIVRLTLDDLTTSDNQTFLRLGDPPTPVPEPIAELIFALRDQRTNMQTATNPTAPWLFPGRRAGQPISAGALAPHLRQLGIPTALGRVAAIRQLVLQAPAPVVAQALGIHHITAHRHRVDAGGTWNRYAPGDHDR